MSVRIRTAAVMLLAILLVAPAFAQGPGADTYKAKCAMCHGADGSKAMPAMGVKPINTPAITGKSEADLVTVITKGQGKMKPQNVTADEAKAAAGFVKTLK